jgi:hypothetical protein
MSKQTNAVAVSTIGIDTGKNTLHMIGLDGIEAGMATHYRARELVL